MTHSGPTLDEIKTAAQARILDVLVALGIHDAPRGGYVHICNPVHKDRHPSFTIWTTRSIGAWKDHRGIAQGDVIDLVAYLKGWSDGPKKGRREALRFLADLLGLASLSPAQRAADAARSKARRQVEDKRAAEELADKQRRAFDLWTTALPIGAAGAELGRAYLASRDIDLAALPKGPRGGDLAPSVLRVLPIHKHTWLEPKSPHNGDVSFWPCLIAGCWDPATARINAVHRTWLAHDGAGKAAVMPDRKVWPDFRGLVIPLWRGDSRLSVTAAIAAGLRETLVLAEGIETALSAALAAPQYRTWAFISLGNLGNLRLPDCIDAVLLHRENDTGNRAAIDAFTRGKRALEQQGRPVAEIAALVGKDLNDTLRGAA
jgi:Toprim domain